MKRNKVPPKGANAELRSFARRPDLSIMAAGWPPYIAREKIGEFTGGIITPKSMANLDCNGEGPKGRITCGRKVAYPINSLISWLESRSEMVEEEVLKPLANNKSHFSTQKSVAHNNNNQPESNLLTAIKPSVDSNLESIESHFN